MYQQREGVRFEGHTSKDALILQCARLPYFGATVIRKKNEILKKIMIQKKLKSKKEV